MNAEVKRPKYNPLTGRTKLIWHRLKKDNHLRDCECMNLVGAMLSGCMPIPQDSVAEESIGQSNPDKIELEKI